MPIYVIAFDICTSEHVEKLAEILRLNCPSTFELLKDRAWAVSFSGKQIELEELLEPCHSCLVDRIFITKIDALSTLQAAPKPKDEYQKWLNRQLTA